MKTPARRVLHVLTVADSLIFIDALVAQSLQRGFEVGVATSDDERLQAFGQRFGIRTWAVDMPRKVAPLGDWAALTSLYDLMRGWAPGIVHAHTPKGGLLGSLAAHAAQVPVRLYHMRGLPFVTLRGSARTLLQTTERLSCRAATKVICQSPSLRRAALAHRLVSPQKCEVILSGSNGVDCERFSPSVHAQTGRDLRRRWGIAPGDVVFVFVGRLVRDKGVPELLQAFSSVAAQNGNVWLVLAGPLESRDAIDEHSQALLRGHARILSLGFVKDTEGIYAAADVVVLPSHREGFPNVPLEAAAMERPVLSTSVDGCTDAVEDGVTGILVPAGDAQALARALARYAADEALRTAHGRAGRARVEASFRRDRIAQATVDVYEAELLRSAGSALP